VSARFFSLKVAIDPFGFSRDAAMSAISDAIAQGARTRGIAPREVIDHGREPLSSSLDLVVIGERDESQGFDADGAPTSEWPVPSLPWGPST
jgi:hypothetical protein